MTLLALAVALLIVPGAGLAWALCRISALCHVAEHASDEHAEWLGTGSDSFPHDREYR